MNTIHIFLSIYSVVLVLFIFTKIKTAQMFTLTKLFLHLSVGYDIVCIILILIDNSWFSVGLILSLFVSIPMTFGLGLVVIIKNNEQKHVQSNNTNTMTIKEIMRSNKWIIILLVIGMTGTIFYELYKGNYHYGLKYYNLTIVDENTQCIFNNSMNNHLACKFDSKAIYKSEKYNYIRFKKNKINFDIPHNFYEKIYPIKYIKSGNTYLEAFVLNENAEAKLMRLLIVRYVTLFYTVSVLGMMIWYHRWLKVKS